MSEFRAVGSSLFSVRAEDLDLQEKIKYGTEGISPAPTYFSCDEDTGEIKIARDLRQDRKTAYIVGSLVFALLGKSSLGSHSLICNNNHRKSLMKC